MKIILLLEPPYSMVALELEDFAAPNQFTYFSMSDAFMNEAGSKSEIGQLMAAKETPEKAKEIYKALVKRYLSKAPRNLPAGFILDSDCLNNPEELEWLLDSLATQQVEINTAIDIQVDPEVCKEYIPDYIDREEALEEIRFYFEELYPQAIEILKSKAISIEILDEEKAPKQLRQQFIQLLKQ